MNIRGRLEKLERELNPPPAERGLAERLRARRGLVPSPVASPAPGSLAWRMRQRAAAVAAADVV